MIIVAVKILFSLVATLFAGINMGMYVLSAYHDGDVLKYNKGGVFGSILFFLVVIYLNVLMFEFGE